MLYKGVEEVLPLMRLGDRWKLTIPGNMAFGSKGRPSSAGKPRIQPDATIVFEVEMVGLPGREPELIELIGD
jgi:FKBP-type peptidyl-prolyl cis-trans isomerase